MDSIDEQERQGSKFLLSIPFLICLMITVIFLSQCDYYSDNFKEKNYGQIDIQKDGYLIASLLQRNDSIYLSLANISGGDIHDFSYLIQLYKDPNKTRASLFFSQIDSVQILTKGKKSALAFLAKTDGGLNTNTCRFEIISINGQGLFSDLSGLLEGTYSEKKSAGGGLITRLTNGLVTYKGDFVFEADGSDAAFTFFSGRLQTDSSYFSYFLKNDGTVLFNQSGTYSTHKDSLKILNADFTGQMTVTFKLKRKAQ